MNRVAKGTYQVKSIEALSLYDAQRGKEIQARIYYPEDSGSHPAIVFSHGAGASRNEYLALTHTWASHGFVVIQPTHGDSILLQEDLGHKANLPTIIATARKDYKGWIDRCRDLSFVIDSLETLNNEHPLLKGKIDQSRIGIAGHSYGAYTAMLLAGAQLEYIDDYPFDKLHDKRIKSALVLSPPGTGQQGLTKDSFKSLTLPTMFMTGSRDKGLSGQPPEWRIEPFNFCPPGDKYLVFIEGANHFTFAAGRATLVTNQPGPSATILGGTQYPARLTSKFDQRAILGHIKLASTCFWNAYLKEDPASRAYLASDQLYEQSHHLAQIQLR
ncbi:MAG: acetylxylan esterase [Candidatus Obscuribacterales bacterium]|nr:acetylxylan esterase [Candidatus Obscuribacterales bacterium]